MLRKFVCATVALAVFALLSGCMFLQCPVRNVQSDNLTSPAAP